MGILNNSGSKEEDGEYVYEYDSQVFEILNVFWKNGKGVEYFKISPIQSV